MSDCMSRQEYFNWALGRMLLIAFVTVGTATVAVTAKNYDILSEAAIDGVAAVLYALVGIVTAYLIWVVNSE